MSFTDYLNRNRLIKEEQDTGAVLFPDHTPMYMKAELMNALNKEVMMLHRAFKNPTLARVQKDIQNAEMPSVKSLQGYDPESRAKLVQNGILKIHNNKLYIVGNFSRNLAIYQLHNISHPNDDYDLATDASPIAVKIIVEQGVKDRILPHDTVVEEVEGDKYVNMRVRFGEKGTEYGLATFPFTKYKDAPRMFLDYLRRHFTTNLYYDIEKSELIDLGHGLAAIAKKKIFPIGGDLRGKIKDNPINAIAYLAQFSSINEGGPDSRDIETDHISALKDVQLPQDNRKAILKEFKKGIKTALNKNNYIKLLTHFGLLQQIMPVTELNLDIKNGKSKIPSVTIAQMLANHWDNEPDLRDAMPRLGFDGNEANDIVFLVKLPHYAPNTGGAYSVAAFHKDRLRSNLSDRDIIEFADTVAAPNRKWIETELQKPSFTQKHLEEPAQTPTAQPQQAQAQEEQPQKLQAAHFNIEELWQKARKFYEQSTGF